MSTKDDYTSMHTRIESQYENDRNRESAELFKAMIREAFNVTDVIIGHHLSYEWRETRADGFTYTMVQEIPSADTLMFDHDVMSVLFGAHAMEVMKVLVTTPCETRDTKLALMYKDRSSHC